MPVNSQQTLACLLVVSNSTIIMDTGTSIDDNYTTSESGINYYSANEYQINERVNYFMGQVPITSSNHMAVEIVYMINCI